MLLLLCDDKKKGVIVSQIAAKHTMQLIHSSDKIAQVKVLQAIRIG